jgi:hypothetical protein
MTTIDQATVLGIFSSRELAEQAVEELHRIGFNFADIGFVTRDEKNSPRTVIPGVMPGSSTGAATTPIAGAAPLATGANDDVIDTTDEDLGKDDTPGRIAAGATGGGVVGGLIGAAATLLIPGLGPITAAGVLVGALTGLLTGSVAGGLVGALTSLGVSEEEASYYNKEVAAGRVLVSVHAPNRQAEAREVMRRFGALDTQTNNPTNSTTQPGNTVSDTDFAAPNAQEDYPTTDTTTPDPDYTPETAGRQNFTSTREASPAYSQETIGRQNFTSSDDETRSNYPQETVGRQNFVTGNETRSNYPQETVGQETRSDYTPGTVNREDFTPAREASPGNGPDQVMPQTDFGSNKGNADLNQTGTDIPMAPPPPPYRNEAQTASSSGQNTADATTQPIGGYARPEDTSTNPYPEAPYQQQPTQANANPDSPAAPRVYQSDQAEVRSDSPQRTTRPERSNQNPENQDEPKYEPWQQQRPPEPPQQQR